MEIDAFLADSVASVDGKLYVQGGGWNAITTGALPMQHDRIGIGIIIHVPFTATNQTHEFRVQLVDEDGNQLPIGDAPPGSETEDGRIRTIGGQFNVGRPPGLPAGDEQLVAIAININGLPFEKAGQYAFVISIDGSEVTRLVFRVNLAVTPTPIAE